LNIERNIGKKSRKDLTKWEDVEQDLTYFFDDLFGITEQEKMELLSPLVIDDIQLIAKDFSALYNPLEDKDTWFAHIKEIAEKYGFATDMKKYKEDPTAFKGNVSDVAKVLRVLITGRDKTPDLYDIMRILGQDKVKARLSI
jgi:glutamyl-tRNA synthetase